MKKKKEIKIKYSTQKIKPQGTTKVLVACGKNF